MLLVQLADPPLFDDRRDDGDEEGDGGENAERRQGGMLKSGRDHEATMSFAQAPQACSTVLPALDHQHRAVVAQSGAGVLVNGVGHSGDDVFR